MVTVCPKSRSKFLITGCIAESAGATGTLPALRLPRLYPTKSRSAYAELRTPKRYRVRKALKDEPPNAGAHQFRACQQNRKRLHCESSVSGDEIARQKQRHCKRPRPYDIGAGGALPIAVAAFEYPIAHRPKVHARVMGMQWEIKGKVQKPGTRKGGQKLNSSPERKGKERAQRMKLLSTAKTDCQASE